MKTLTVNRNVLLAIFLSGLVFGIPSFVIGFLVADNRADTARGEQAMSAFINEVSALGYLEKEEFQRAHEMLRLSIESNVLLISKHGAPALEGHSPGSTARWLTRYARIRNKHLPIDYSDGGALNERIDAILKEYEAKNK